MDSPVGVSQYALEPSASTLVYESFVLPAQRPASPEIAESPSVTTVGVPTPGPSAEAFGTNAIPATTSENATTTCLTLIRPPLQVDEGMVRPRSGRCQRLDGAFGAAADVSDLGCHRLGLGGACEGHSI